MKQETWVLRRLEQGRVNTYQCMIESAGDPDIKGSITKLTHYVWNLRGKGYVIGDDKTGQLSNYYLISKPEQDTLPGLAA